MRIITNKGHGKGVVSEDGKGFDHSSNSVNKLDAIKLIRGKKDIIRMEFLNNEGKMIRFISVDTLLHLIEEANFTDAKTGAKFFDYSSD